MKETIKNAYEVFSRYRAVKPLDVCTVCCLTAEDEERLFSVPPGEIPASLLMKYTHSARSDKTRIEEVKHFLPRYLDLISVYQFPSHSAELSFSRLLPFDKNEWEPVEFKLLETFAAEYFVQTLNLYPLPSSVSKIDSILVMLWRAEFDIGALLEIWENTDTLESVLHFNDLFFEGFNGTDRCTLANVFGDVKIAGILSNWVDAEKTKKTFRTHISALKSSKSDVDEYILNSLDLLDEILGVE